MSYYSLLAGCKQHGLKIEFSTAREEEKCHSHTYGIKDLNPGPLLYSISFHPLDLCPRNLWLLVIVQP